MIGDKLVIEPYHTQRAIEFCDMLANRTQDRFTLSVAGESGAGKSELAAEIARILNERGTGADVLQQDDYFVFPPKTNHLDSNLRSFKRGENPIFKPLVLFEEDRIVSEELDTSSVTVLAAEGTYTSLLNYVDFRIFIDRDYKQTLEARVQRARDSFDAFMVDVLEREHRIISQHKKLADAVVSQDFNRVIIT
jgi:uridine kinase